MTLFASTFCEFFEKRLIIIPMIRLSYCSFDFPNTLISIMRPQFVERNFRFSFKRRVYSFLKNVFFSFFSKIFEKCFLIKPLYRRSYCTMEHANILFNVARPSLVEGDFSFSYKKRVFFCKNKFFCLFFLRICLKNV